MKNHVLITTLKNLTGNPRGCVYTEPLWGIPFNLYAPYASVYMVALGLSDAQIGTKSRPMAVDGQTARGAIDTAALARIV